MRIPTLVFRSTLIFAFSLLVFDDAYPQSKRAKKINESAGRALLWQNPGNISHAGSTLWSRFTGNGARWTIHVYRRRQGR